MMILSLDSTAKTCAAALTNGESLLGEVTLGSGYTHSETLLPSVEFLLRASRLTVADVDVFSCAVGPGSFTGVRIGAATVKGLAFGRGRVCAAVDTLEALAENVAVLGVDALAVPVMDARRDQVYAAVFDVASGSPDRLTEDDALSVDALGDLLEKLASGRRIYFVGDGYDLVRDRLSARLPGVAVTPLPLREHSAYSVGRVAHRRLASETLTLVDAETLSPTYLRPSQAEREYNEKHKNGGQ